MNAQVLIKHYKYKDLTDACLDSIRKTDNLFIEVIDSSGEEPYTHPKADSIRTISNDIGLIESFNRFIEPDYDVVFCLNNDIVCHDSFITSVLKTFKLYPTIGILAPLYDQPGGGILEWIPPVKVDDPHWSEYVWMHLPGDLKFTKHVDNCAWAFSSKLIKAIGLPDGNFPGAGWGANLDYCYRARKAGFEVAACGSAFVHHNHRGTYGKIDPNYVTNAEKQRDEYLRKKYGDSGVVW